MHNLNKAYSDDPLFIKLNGIAPLSESLCIEIRNSLKIEYGEPGQSLITPALEARRIWFIDEGFVRAYYTDESGGKSKEKTTWFMGRHDIMISVKSFFQGGPCDETIQVIEACKLRYLTRRKMEELYRRFPEFNVHGRLLTEAYYVSCEERQRLRLTTNARDRYLKLLETQPGIEDRVSQTIIATYLDVTPETLSRIRRDQNTEKTIFRTA